MPQVVVIAGPNGAGKTTASRSVLLHTYQIPTYVNPDIIAQGLSGFAPEAAAFEASAIMLKRLRQMAANGDDFSFETTLAARTYAPWLREIQKTGYFVRLVYVWLKSADLAVDRVKWRVRQGGHSIPEPTIRQRYVRSWDNFLRLYQPFADEWLVFDNSDPAGQQLLACGECGTVLQIFDPEIWDVFSKGPMP